MSEEICFSEQQAAETLRCRSLTALVDTTNRCNLRCRMCWFSHASHAGRAPHYMTRETFEAVARQVFPFARTVYLSAATEPLMHPGFPALLEIAGRYPIEDLKFLTNGQLLTGEIGEACVRHGVGEIHVSIDGATAETYEWIRRGSRFDRLLGNLETLAEIKRRIGSLRPLVQFNVTLMRRNIAELAELVRLAHRLGVRRIACRHLVVFEGLGMEEESLARDRARANEWMGRGLREAAALGVSVVQFPDFFADGKAEEPPWGRGSFAAEPILPSTRPRSGPVESLSAGVRLRTRIGRCLPARHRWSWQAYWMRPRGRQQNKVPIGRWDEPREAVVEAQAGRLLEGWALHGRGIDRVVLCRELLPGESAPEINELGLVPLGTARRHNGTRPDVALRWPDFPERHQAGWSFRLSAQGLPETDVPLRLHAIGCGRDGRMGLLGSRTLVGRKEHPGLLPPYCRKPFDFIYIDPYADLFPHPECRMAEPCGSLAGRETFEAIWNGGAFRELRRRIVAVNPPAMCAACPDFINRCVNDPRYFSTRPLAEDRPR